MKDIVITLSNLKKSKFRSKFYLTINDKEYINKRGLDTIREHAYRFVTERLSSANPNNDGKQTPMRGHPVFVAQHATATCCRECLYKWHSIGKGKELTKTEIDFIVELIMAWIEEKYNLK